jgi:hypothetical protein
MTRCSNSAHRGSVVYGNLKITRCVLSTYADLFRFGAAISEIEHRFAQNKPFDSANLAQGKPFDSPGLAQGKPFDSPGLGSGQGVL